MSWVNSMDAYTTIKGYNVSSARNWNLILAIQTDRRTLANSVNRHQTLKNAASAMAAKSASRQCLYRLPGVYDYIIGRGNFVDIACSPLERAM